MYIKKSKLVLITIIVVLATAIVSVTAVNPFGTDYISLIKLSYATKLLDALYLEDVDKKEAAEMAVAGVAASTGDPYTGYVWGDDATQYMEQMEGNYCGVGLYIENDTEENLISVVSPIAGGPAEKSGIATGDKIIMIDGQTYTGAQLSEASSYMKGEEGTDVVVTIRSAIDGTNRDITLTRSRIVIESVSGKMLDNNIGYVNITQFTEGVAESFSEQLKTLDEQNMKSLIIDLRNNPGGILEEVISVSSLFVPEERIVTYTLDKYENRTEYLSEHTEKKYSLPIVVLINGGSASASEVLTGVLRDYKIATVIGEQSYGKGVVQSVVPIGFDSLMTVTVSRYYTPNGECIHGTGITPDIVSEMEPEKTVRLSSLQLSEDTQLIEAINFLKK